MCLAIISTTVFYIIHQKLFSKKAEPTEPEQEKEDVPENNPKNNQIKPNKERKKKTETIEQVNEEILIRDNKPESEKESSEPVDETYFLEGDEPKSADGRHIEGKKKEKSNLKKKSMEKKETKKNQ